MASGSQSISCPVKKAEGKGLLRGWQPGEPLRQPRPPGPAPAGPWSRKALPAAVSSTPRTLRDSSSAPTS